jgi:hypothetical protein
MAQINRKSHQMSLIKSPVVFKTTAIRHPSASKSPEFAHLYKTQSARWACVTGSVPISRIPSGGTVKLTRIARDDPFDVGLPLLFSTRTSLRSTLLFLLPPFLGSSPKLNASFPRSERRAGGGGA